MLRVVPIYERLKPILTTEPETDELKAYPGQLKGRIELSHVHFRYQADGPWICATSRSRSSPASSSRWSVRRAPASRPWCA